MSDGCELSVKRTMEGYLVRLVGRGTMQYSPTLRDFACGHLEDGARVVLDLSECEYLDSTFLGCLVMLTKRARAGEGKFRVAANDEHCTQLFGSSNLQKVFSRQEVPEAFGEWVALPTTTLERREFGQHLLDMHRELAAIPGPNQAAFQAVVERLEQDMR